MKVLVEITKNNCFKNYKKDYFNERKIIHLLKYNYIDDIFGSFDNDYNKVVKQFNLDIPRMDWYHKFKKYTDPEEALELIESLDNFSMYDKLLIVCYSNQAAIGLPFQLLQKYYEQEDHYLLNSKEGVKFRLNDRTCVITKKLKLVREVNNKMELQFFIKLNLLIDFNMDNKWLRFSWREIK